MDNQATPLKDATEQAIPSTKAAKRPQTTSKDATEEAIPSTKATKRPQTTEEATEQEVNNPESNNNRKSWVWNHFKCVENMTGTNCPYYYLFGGDEEDVSTNTRKRKRKDRVVGPPGMDDWENARYFLQFLKVFYKVTVKIYGSKYLTSNLFFNELVKMHVNIGKMCSSRDPKCCNMAKRMKEKYDKYWENIDNVNFLLYVAVLLDPRKKMQYVEFSFAQIYVEDRDKQILMKEKVKNTLDALYKDYVRLQENVSNDIKTKKCTSTTSEALICAQDWLRSKPTDIENLLGIVEDIRQKLEEVELDEMSKAPKYLFQVFIEE
ncbi:hypothetical protein POM88_034003 [Heracleum sosnowskyi]|uniref:hAT-like transposase RNase-H fold domain-containing protein n=1 Tax=Heracleum sosnowskyi TaxID=360622 RepID=A0AAD8HIP9_9APIA|nr:hypothetical protein POM88_034003 [Heracleum sosnowskyi]